MAAALASPFVFAMLLSVQGLALIALAFRLREFENFRVELQIEAARLLTIAWACRRERPVKFRRHDRCESLADAIGESTTAVKRVHSAGEIVAKLRLVDELSSTGRTVGNAVQAIGVTEVTYYRWKKRYGGLRKRHRRVVDGAGDRERPSPQGSVRSDAG